MLAATLLTFVVLLAFCYRWRGGKAVAIALLPSLLTLIVSAAVIAANIQVSVSSKNRPNDMASSLKTSAVDLAALVIEVMSPTLMTTTMRDQMLEPEIRVNARTWWANGIGVDESEEQRTYWHWGSNPGYQSLIVFNLEGDGVVILTNGGGFADFEFGHQVFLILW